VWGGEGGRDIGGIGVLEGFVESFLRGYGGVSDGLVTSGSASPERRWIRMPVCMGAGGWLGCRKGLVSV